MNTIILASRNRDKIRELEETLADLDLELKSTLDYPGLEEVEEDELTLEGNAIKKARYVYEETGLPALADDTGLEVDALDGRPGVFSARYAGEQASYADNRRKLLEELAEVKPKDRKAQFRTVAAFISVRGVHTFEGICRGTILQEPRGSGGFGYDPLFRPDGFKETFAEMEPSIKNKISHRGKAIRKFHDWLEKQANL
ncbi:MAG: RdgB/HAM1 family non-canonical purine NTP pyrophosphatase [Balneolaceae bacterium]|nr:RdgB/HAM1 family non-canonical purine NTP pyrophosphatase [Balneolaceae bacterium]